MTDETDLSNQVETARSAFEATIAAHLAAGADRCLLAAACIWTGIKEMTEIVSSESAAATLRTIADQMEQPAEYPGSISADGAGKLVGTTRALKQKATTKTQRVVTTQTIVGDVVEEAIDLIDHGHLRNARALLIALRASVSPE